MIVLGTAGHVDHGKTTLVKAMTGIDTDRLKVEQERGITTELGFAHLDLGDGQSASVIDVPGHERFVRHMIAGAGGVDAALLVVAADEGVMPQTREHLDILGIVGVRAGLVVLTKCDLVDADGLELATEDLTAALAGTFLESAPILRFSAPDPASHAATRAGIIRWLRDRFPAPPPRPVDRPVRLPIDRVFVMKGFGAVVTGTLTAGRLAVGDDVAFLPGGLTGRVRGLQRHGEPIERVEAGQRTAVNVQGVGYEEIRRGQVLTLPGSLTTGTVVDATFTLLPRLNRGVKRRTAVVFHTGTLQTEATLVLVDRESIEPGESALVQVRLPGPIATLAGDPFVVRGFETLPGYGRTLGGGRILHPASRPLRFGDSSAVSLLGRIRDGTGPERVAAAVEKAGVSGASNTDLLAVTDLGQRELAKALGSLLSSGGLASVRRSGVTRYVGPLTLRRIEDRLIDALSNAHERKPERDGFSIEDLVGGLAEPVPTDVAMLAARRLAQRKALEEIEGRLRIPGRVTLASRLGPETLARVEAAFVEAGLATPTPFEAANRLGIAPATALEATTVLVQAGRLSRAPENLFFAVGPLSDLKARVVAFLKQHGTMTTGQFKELSGVSRKYSIPLLEWLDSERITIRLADGTRKLRYDAAEPGASGET